ncbi:MFS transporter [Ramlibacter sp. Leaf400]|uniref:MFS transporter n=1 Tax=Ramlibacter sp. Leaf400 TaxID=1736365 RepID=UPI0007000530|nr:MFS transporter [Ramlibacter sp. Leaf400]KQT12965.1 MFS transporter [Ramlibacter sp. Leaf400]
MSRPDAPRVQASASAPDLLSRRDAVLVFLAFAFAYFFSALVRAVTATLAPTLTPEFALSARDLGLLAGGYFFGFAATQLPLGNWLDRHGPKKVILAFLLVAVAGCVAFSLATSFPALLAARVLCGVGVSACLMAPLTGFRRWLEPGTQLRANSWMLMTGSFGMLASTLPVQWLVPLFGWRPLFWGLAALIALSMVLIAWRVPHWETAPEAAAAPGGSYEQVWRDPYFRRMTPIGFFTYGGMIAVQTLWAGPWMVRVAGYQPMESAAGLFTINLCMLVTFWTWGMVNPMLARRGITTDRLIAWGTPLSVVALAGIVVAGPAAGPLALALFCVSSTFVSLAQPAVGMAFPTALAGRALSAYNLVIFLGVFVMQWGIGLLVDGFRALGWAEVAAFRGAFTVFLALSAASYAWFLLGSRDNRTQPRPASP